jgi:hypothetical protein
LFFAPQRFIYYLSQNHASGRCAQTKKAIYSKEIDLLEYEDGRPNSEEYGFSWNTNSFKKRKI